MKTTATVSCSHKVELVLRMRARAARLRAIYDVMQARLAPVRHGAAELLLEARALKSRMAPAERSELRRRILQRA
jgi:hypothetical protein